LGFLDYCGIEAGEDLQGDFVSGDKAAALLGILTECYEGLSEEVSDSQWESWKAVGIRQLKIQKSRKYK